MTLRSMTGFGRGEHGETRRRWIIEVRSVNHRFLDIKIRMPRTLTILEEPVKKILAKSFTRGRVDFFCEPHCVSTESAVVPDRERARQYRDGLSVIQETLGVQGKIDIAALLACGDLFPVDDENIEPDEAWQEIHPAVDEAVSQCLRMRIDEGVRLVHDLSERLDLFQEYLQKVSDALPEILVSRKTRLEERLAELNDAVSVDPQRLAQEVAILVDKSDVTEEMVRLNSHISQFVTYLHQREPVGRRLDFLLQEFFRETNTMAAKVNNAAAGHYLVEMKNILEKMREQVQNLE